jgi:hypothetical protein
MIAIRTPAKQVYSVLPSSAFFERYRHSFPQRFPPKSPGKQAHCLATVTLDNEEVPYPITPTTQLANQVEGALVPRAGRISHVCTVCRVCASR